MRVLVTTFAIAMLVRPGRMTAQAPVAADSIYTAETVTQPPLVIPYSCRAVALGQALRHGESGTVVLELVVDTLGRVEPELLRIVRSDKPALEEPARRMELSCRFIAGKVDGRRVRVRMQVTTNFASR
jgi:hypothetical protein